MSSFSLGPVYVGGSQPCCVIAEVGLGHDGSLGQAHAYIDAAAEAGADAVKFQTHIAAAEGTSEEVFRVNVFPQDKTRQDYWNRTAFDESQWFALSEHVHEKGMAFLSSPFSVEAADLLMRVGVDGWKVASGETGNVPLLRYLGATGLPLLLSSGMSPLVEVDQALEAVSAYDIPVLLFQCTNLYPCPPEAWGLNMLSEYRERYQLPVGLSDHSGTPTAGIAAAALGASALEVHITWHKQSFGPDVHASLTIEELKQLVDGVRQIDRALATPVDKDEKAEELSGIRELFTKSIVAARDLDAGMVIKEKDLAFKKPGTGIPAAEHAWVEGRVLRSARKKDEQFRFEDFEG